MYLNFNSRPQKSYSKYAFYVDFADGTGGVDRVSGTPMQTVLSAGRVKPDGTVLGVNEPCIQDGKLNTLGQINNSCLWSEDITQASWGKTLGAVAISPTQINMPVTDSQLKASPISVVSGEVVRSIVLLSGSGTINIMLNGPSGGTKGELSVTLTDIPTWYTLSFIWTATENMFFIMKKQATNTATVVNIHKTHIYVGTYNLPYVKTTDSIVTTPHGYSDSDEGYKWPIASCPKLLTALQGTAGNNAMGSIEVEWVPQYDYTALADGFWNFISCLNNTKPLLLRAIPPSSYVLRLSDGIASSDTTVVLFSKGVKYKASANYGPHPSYAGALKMQISITDWTTTWVSLIEDFDGSFNPTTHLSIGFNNPYWQQLKSIKVKRG